MKEEVCAASSAPSTGVPPGITVQMDLLPDSPEEDAQTTNALTKPGGYLSAPRHKPEEITSKLRRVDVLVGQGVSRIDAIREISITEQTYNRCRKQYGGMGTNQLNELKRLMVSFPFFVSAP